MDLEEKENLDNSVKISEGTGVKKRLVYMDIAKGLGIILIIIGHMTTNQIIKNII